MTFTRNPTVIKLMQHLKNLVKTRRETGDSHAVEDPTVIERFKADPENSFLISFPRTGSHWLRMLMELYFERPSLVRSFYFPEKTDYLCYHTHDLELDIVHEKVIYLYRNPVDTIYSQLKYHKQNPANYNSRKQWIDLYGKHLNKWLLKETFTRQKTVLYYDIMRIALDAEFNKVCRFFGKSFDPQKLDQIREIVSKDTVKENTAHDKQVITIDPSYDKGRIEFAKNYTNEVNDGIFQVYPGLESFFSLDFGSDQ